MECDLYIGHYAKALAREILYIEKYDHAKKEEGGDYENE